MKISEAMRAGLRQLSEAQPQMKQITGDYARDSEGCCAAGMAFLGSGLAFEHLAHYMFDETSVLPEIGDPVPTALLPEAYRALHPAAHDPSLITVITVLNDPPMAWPIEQIIEYVEDIGR